MIREQAMESGEPRKVRYVSNSIEQVPGWSIASGKLTRDFKVKDFKQALGLLNQVGELAEAENHHPDIGIHSWNHVRIELYTHTINGLSENDFALATKINQLWESFQSG